jgi:hypothetical protein
MKARIGPAEKESGRSKINSLYSKLPGIAVIPATPGIPPPFSREKGRIPGVAGMTNGGPFSQFGTDTK